MWQRSAEANQELTWDDWLPVMENLADSGITKIELFGGDALLRKDALIPMINFCRDQKIQTFFPTNSSALTEKTARELVDAGLNVIYLSLDELPEFDGSIRGTKRHFEKVMRAMDWLQSARGRGTCPRIECITTVSASNWRYLPDLLTFSRDRGADAHHIWAMSDFPIAAVNASAVEGITPNPYFMATDGVSHRLSNADAEVLKRLLRKIRNQAEDYAPMSIKMVTIEHLDAESLASLRFPHQKCLVCTNSVIVSPYGDVMPCPYFSNYILGNLQDGKLKDIWGNNPHRVFTRMQHAKKLPLCNHCSLKFVYRPFVSTLKNEVDRTFERIHSIAAG